MLPKAQISRLEKKIAVASDERITAVFTALSDLGRFKIFKFLLQHQGVCVTDMARIFKVTSSAISQRMRVLEMAGLIKRQRFGQLICYQVKQDDPLVKCLENCYKILNKIVKNK